MKIIVMNGRKGTWYEHKVGKLYEVVKCNANNYELKEGFICKADAQIIER